MKSSSKKTKASNKRTNPSLKTIEVEQNIKFKNELFQKLFDNNIASKSSKERLNSHGNLHFHKKYKHRSPEISKHTKKISYKNRNRSNLLDDPKNKRGIKSSNSKNSKKENNTFSNTNSNSTKIIKPNKLPRQNNNIPNNNSNTNTNSTKKLKNYPNLIKGVLHQVQYYNLNKNNNYNDNIRYKPVDDFYNEQTHPPIYIGNIIENNTNSSNNSFNLDFKQEQKYNNQTNSSDNYANNIKKIEINDDDNKEYIEKEIRPSKIIYRKKNIEINNIKNLKSISPITKKTIDKVDSTDIINEDIYNSNNIDNFYNTNKNINTQNTNSNFIDSDNNIYLRSKNNDKYMSPKINNIQEEHIDNRENIIPIKIEEEKKPNIVLTEDKTNNFSIYRNNMKNYNEKLDFYTAYSFSISNDIIKEKNFGNLEMVNCNIITYIGKKVRNKIYKGPNYDSNGNLIFSNDEEVLKYIKNKIKEEKNMEYNNKIKYNYFILSKQFHGKLLYEIGLENNLNKINEILEKENVEVEHEPIMIIFKKDFNKINSHKQNYDENEEIEKIVNEKEELIKENKLLMNQIDLLNKNGKINMDEKEEENDDENDIVKLKEEIEKLNDENKEKGEVLNEMQNILNEYRAKLKQYEEINNVFQNEKEKYSKYIIELQEYNEKIIIEYQKMKSQLELEIQKNQNNYTQNYFNNDKLNIISTDFFDILNIKHTKENNYNDNKVMNEKINKKDNQNNDDNYIEKSDNNLNVNNYNEDKNIDNYNEDNNINNNNEDRNGNGNDFCNEEINLNNNIEIITDNENNYNKIKNNFENEDNTNKKNDKEESLNRALQRIKNMKESQQKNNTEDEVLKSEKISQMADILEKKFMENPEYNNYQDKENNNYQSYDSN